MTPQESTRERFEKGFNSEDFFQGNFAHGRTGFKNGTRVIKQVKDFCLSFIESECTLREERIRTDVVKIIGDSKATFFVRDHSIIIPAEEELYELKAEISNNVEMYFYRLSHPEVLTYKEKEI